METYHTESDNLVRKKHATSRDVFTMLLHNKSFTRLIISKASVNKETEAKLSTLTYYAKYNLVNEMLNPIIDETNKQLIS